MLTLPVVEHNNFIKFVLQYSLRKSNAIWFHCFFAFAFISLIHSKNTLAILLEFGIAILLISLYLKIRTLRYLNDINDDKENDNINFLSMEIKKNKIVIILYSI